MTKLLPPDGVPTSAWAKIAKKDGNRWAIPERDANGEIIGTAYRAADGGKDFKQGGRRGLILEWPVKPYTGTSIDAPIFVCEGASDTAAVLGLGLDAVGVPMAGHCGAMVAELLAELHAVIVADGDDAGRRGAAKIAKHMTKRCASVRIMEPPLGAKDARAAVIAGADRSAFLDAARAAKPAETTHNETNDAPALGVFKPFPVDVLPEPMRALVVEGAKAIGCDPSFIALPLLSSAAAAIGTTYRVELKPGWTEPAIVWTAIVGLSGTMKTPAFKLAMKALRKAQAEAFKEHDAALPDWEAEHLRYEAELAAWKRQAAKGHGDAGDPPTKPDALTARRYIVSDTTTEALAPMLRDNPRGVLLARDELAGWLGSFDRYAKSGKGGGDSAHWLSMHNADAMTIDRKTGIPPTIHVPSAAVSITGGIQPGTLGRALGQEHHESGMAARILYAMPPRKPKRWTDASVSASTESAVASVFKALLSLWTDIDEHGDERPWIVPLTESAASAWKTFYDQHAREQMGLDEDLSAAWSKLEGYAARLALVIHLTRWAVGDPAVPVSTTAVDAQSIAAGVAMARWFGDEAKRVYAILAESDDDAETRRLVEWIESKGGTVTARDLTRGPREYRDADKAAEALAELVASGHAVRIPDEHGPRGGRPADRVRLVLRGGDAGDGDETPESIGNGDGCVTVATPKRADGGKGGS